MAYKITDSCVACGSCIGECPVEAISAGDIYVIDADKCIDCGTCAGVCRSNTEYPKEKHTSATGCAFCGLKSRFPHPTTNESWAISKK